MLKILIRGRAADANEVVQQARVVLAPLRFGAGIKGKLVEAMLCGTPSVTTSIG
jgi:glycosyltransferase involved in cell wall biosynthesis